MWSVVVAGSTRLRSRIFHGVLVGMSKRITSGATVSASMSTVCSLAWLSPLVVHVGMGGVGGSSASMSSASMLATSESSSRAPLRSVISGGGSS